MVVAERSNLPSDPRVGWLNRRNIVAQTDLFRITSTRRRNRCSRVNTRQQAIRRKSTIRTKNLPSTANAKTPPGRPGRGCLV